MKSSRVLVLLLWGGLILHCPSKLVDNQVCVYIELQPVERRVEPIVSKRFSSLQTTRKGF